MTKKNFLWAVVGSFVTVFCFTLGLQLALVEDADADPLDCICCVVYCPEPCDDAIQLRGAKLIATDPCGSPVQCGPGTIYNCPGPFYGLMRDCPDPGGCE